MSQYMDKCRTIRASVDPHYNCAQGVLIPFAKERGLDEDTAYALAANFGSGMKMGSTCGAVTGSLMVLGLYGLSDSATVQEFYRAFREKHENMMNCRDLLAASHKRGEVQKTHCDGLVFECLEITENILRKHGKLAD